MLEIIAARERNETTHPMPLFVLRLEENLLKALGPLHCNGNTIYVFPEMKLCGLILNSYIHVSVSDLYISRMGLPILLQQNRQTAHRHMNVEVWRQNIIILLWK